jgi:hypothetical protein
VESRLRENPSAVAGLDEQTVARIRRGEIVVGDSEAIVRLALGEPMRTEPRAEGGATWFYRAESRDPNDYIAGGFRHRVVFDPVTRTNLTTVEPVPDYLFPNLRTHLIRVGVRDGRVIDVKIQED